VPLNRPAEPLALGPRGAAEARRWVVRACSEIGRDDLAESAELALSEVVTNAILHGKPPLSVRLRGTMQHPRVEVRDGSSEPPAIPDPEHEFDTFEEITTFGRGLSIVARSSEAWGAEREPDGKLVWFVPSADGSDDAVAGVLLGWDDPEDDTPPFPLDQSMVVHLTNVPTDALQETLSHGAELRRELRLLAVAHQDTYPVAADLSSFFSSLARDFRAQLGGDPLREAIRTRATHFDLDVRAPLDSEERFTRLMELLDLADVFCRHERLLTLARTPEQEEFQDWLFGEFARQAAGMAPQPWAGGRRSLHRAQP
jgi:anti-sigma regulatory factor (Ser/Thr protein kinase)